MRKNMASISVNKEDVQGAGISAPQVLRFGTGFILIFAAVILLFSFSYPYWVMHLDAPQYEYRDGLDIVVYPDRMKGKDPKFDELRELNSLNHYIGMRPLDEAASLERSIALPSMIAFAVLLIAAALSIITRRYWKIAWLLVLPAFFYPFVFLGDLYYWLRDSGLNLDPTAPFSSTIHPFVPTMIGEGKVGQFVTHASVDTGWYMVFFTSILILLALGLWFYQYWQSRQKAQPHA
jgi:copper chaperone NosL